MPGFPGFAAGSPYGGGGGPSSSGFSAMPAGGNAPSGFGSPSGGFNSGITPGNFNSGLQYGGMGGGYGGGFGPSMGRSMGLQTGAPDFSAMGASDQSDTFGDLGSSKKKDKGNKGTNVAPFDPTLAQSSVLGPFMNPLVQNIPGFTDQQNQIFGTQMGRAYGDPLTPQEYAAQQSALGLGQTTGPEQQALQNSQQAGSQGFNMAEMLGLGQIGQVAGGPLGSSPATQAALAAAREPVLNDLALAGLGNSSAMGTALSGAYAPILAQEMQQRAQSIPQLIGLGQQQRGAGLQGAGLQAQIGNAMRQGDLGTVQALMQLGGTSAGRQSELLGEAGQTAEAQRGLAESGQAAQYQDVIRRQELASSLIQGIFGALPGFMGSKTTSSSSGGGSK